MRNNIVLAIFLIASVFGLSYGEDKSSGPKLSWFYLSYGTILDYWLDYDSRIRQIDEIDDYPGNAEERPKTLQTLKAGGLFSINEMVGLYFELPFYYNRVEPYQSNNQGTNYETDSRELFSLGDSVLGVNLRWNKMVNSTFFLKFPSHPFEVSRGESRASGEAWPGLGALQGGINSSLKIKKHFIYLTGEMIFYDPFESGDTNLNWPMPGDLSIYAQYVYTIDLTRFLFLKPWAYLTYSTYHWSGESNPPDERLALGPGISLSLYPKRGHEVSLSTSWGASVFRRRGDERQPNTYNLTFGLYYGLYR